MNNSHLIVVDSSVLPEVILKVLKVKKMLAGREVKSSAAACKEIGVSRSAYYKYRDCVYSYEEKLMQKIITLYMLLRDEPGVLSSVLVSLHSLNANILTVNQSIPVDGIATVTISLRLNESFDEALAMKAIIAELRGVVDIQLLSGE
ncbi:MAG: ACT domain-containing protein [Clostridium sp.]|nr:ACT domain-containing protein [Clostridium sp.]MCM1547812.1 ACT domain-containing protein [Ruminococcus sp.]